jgi:2-C-methyl-D-erythritol 4-phosphate cytidylyltransferase
MSPQGRTAALVPAAGRGERLGPGSPKALRLLAGAPMLVHAVHGLAASRSVDLIVVAAPAGQVDEVKALLGQQEISSDIIVVSGGDTRQDSVARALLALPVDIDVVLVHDAARPLVPPEVIASVVAAVRKGAPAVVPAVPVVDTIKQVGDDDEVVGTPERSRLRAVQTPQGFSRQVLQAAHARVEADTDPATDDAGLVERAGVTVRVIAGHEEAFKVTRPIDLTLAEAILARRRATGGLG